MNYINIADSTEVVSFKEATLKGLGRNKGLFVPSQLPSFPINAFHSISSENRIDLATRVMYPFVTPSLTKQEVKEILAHTFSFETPVVHIGDNRYCLELFHGPTLAFKDTGARFMARCLQKFNDDSKEVTVLVATSGDTGSAVANGFYNVDGVRVVILFPKGMVSPFQEYQMTSLGKNIQAIEVDGTFDDCQALVKQALQDQSLKEKLTLSSANSINVARFLPQMLYYFFMMQQIEKLSNNKEVVVAVPSGNFGNLTAGLYAQQIGLPIHQFIAANNENDTFYQFLQTGEYKAKPSVQTYSNAMDVGDPSNFSRIDHLFHHSHKTIQDKMIGETITDDEILQEIATVNQTDKYLLDPHAAVAHLALRRQLNSNQIGVVLGTAHPKKFASVMQRVIKDFNAPIVDSSNNHKDKISVDYQSYKHLLLN